MKKLATTKPNFDLEKAAFQQGFFHIIGVDEAGRGPIAGPVVVASVVLKEPWSDNSTCLDDSKRLSETKREYLFDAICKNALAYNVACVDADLIDELNIFQATLFGMKEVTSNLNLEQAYVLVDGNKLPDWEYPAAAIVKGDQKSQSIAAASILAKVTRDRMMMQYDQEYPEWQFAKHKGYPTKQHRNLVDQYGLSPIHRRSFQCGSLPKESQLSLFDV